jgi:hypothetical protein
MGALMAELMADPGTEIVANLAGWWRMVGDSAVLQSRMRLMWERQQATAARDWVNISLSLVGDGRDWPNGAPRDRAHNHVSDSTDHETGRSCTAWARKPVDLHGSAFHDTDCVGQHYGKPVGGVHSIQPVSSDCRGSYHHQYHNAGGLASNVHESSGERKG